MDFINPGSVKSYARELRIYNKQTDHAKTFPLYCCWTYKPYQLCK